MSPPPAAPSPPLRRAAPCLSALAALLLGACQATGGGAPASGGGPQLSLDARLRLAAATDAQQGGSAATFAVLSEAAAAAPNDVALQERLAAVAEANDRWDDAAAALRRVVAQAPTQDRLMRLGRIELRTGAPSATDTWRRAVAAGGRSAEALTGLGLALDLARDHAAAQATYRDALSVDPGYWAAAANLGMSLMLSRQPAAAVDALARAEADPSAPARARHNLAIALAMSGQDARMLRLLRSDPSRSAQQVTELGAEVRQFARWLTTRENEPPPIAAGPTAPPTAAEPAPASPEPAPRPTAAAAPPSAPADPPAAVPVQADPPGRPAGPVVRMEPIVNPGDPQARAAAQALPATATAPPAPAAAEPARPAAASPAPPADTPPPPRPVAAATGGGALVQLGALESEAAAQRQWSALSGRVGALAGHTPSIERFETNGRTVWRLRVRGLTTLAEATALCGSVRAAGAPCFAAR